MPVSMKKIAEEVGCTVQSVSSVFKNNSTTRVSEQLRRKVLAVADELGYVPNRLSSALRKKRSGMIALILPWDVPEIMDMVNQEAARHDLKVLTLFTHAADSAREADAIDAALAYQVEGLIWTPYFDASSYLPQLARLRERKIPLVYMLNKLSELPGDFAGIDFCGGMKKSVDHLLECGYEKLYYIVPRNKFPPRDQRKEFFVKYAGSRGVLLETQLGKKADIRGIISRRSGVIMDDFCGLTFIHEFHKRHIAIPGNVGVVIYDDHLLGGVITVSQIMVPPMTSCRTEHGQLGKAAVDLLIKRMTEPDQKDYETVLPMTFTVRESTKREGCKK